MQRKMSSKITRCLSSLVLIGAFVFGSVLMSKVGDYISKKNQWGTYDPAFIEANQSRIEIPPRNYVTNSFNKMQIPVFPSSENGFVRGRLILTDIDYDGKWDLLDQELSGFTPGNYSKDLFYKEGYGLARSLPFPAKVHTVKPEFFKSYESPSKSG
jgi:hypothetical protein